MIGLRPIRSDNAANRIKHGVPIASATATMICAVTPATFRVWVRKKQRVELPAIPDDGFARGRAKQRGDRDFAIAPFAESFRERPARLFALFDHAPEQRRFIELEANPQGDGEQDRRQQKRDSPSPVAKWPFAHIAADAENNEQ